MSCTFPFFPPYLSVCIFCVYLYRLGAWFWVRFLPFNLLERERDDDDDDDHHHCDHHPHHETVTFLLLSAFHRKKKREKRRKTENLPGQIREVFFSVLNQEQWGSVSIHSRAVQNSCTVFFSFQPLLCSVLCHSFFSSSRIEFHILYLYSYIKYILLSSTC